MLTNYICNHKQDIIMISKDPIEQQANATFSLIYVIQKGKLKKDCTAPILARITLNGKMSHVSTKL